MSEKFVHTGVMSNAVMETMDSLATRQSELKKSKLQAEAKNDVKLTLTLTKAIAQLETLAFAVSRAVGEKAIAVANQGAAKERG